ncbi:hypothetical protein ACFFU8_09190 [Chromobacterium piscinae]|uniref:hypothetical protein n=1 Tax=Chromobacterium piscinae TaxID=686831 RepID=UPI001E3E0ED9|nr:hypothetical protein [Chromobacterium piscinae]MCD5327922.1 hypothetical protein [Chromobacterium piscinae]
MEQFICRPEVVYHIGNEFLISGAAAIGFMILFLTNLNGLRDRVKARKAKEGATT